MRSLLRRTVLAIPCCLVIAGSAGGQPGPRGHHTVFYDSVRQRVMVTGGAANDARRNSTFLNDLWSFDGVRWTALPSSGEKMSGIRVAQDARGRIWSFGGYTDSTIADVRVLENDRWRRAGAHPSLTLAEAGFVFDAARGKFVMFGGSGRRPNGEVWEFDGAAWTRHAASAPPARFMHAMVYDAKRRKTVVFGGMGVRVGNADTPILDDTWEFDGVAWSRIAVAGPPARAGAGAAYDSKRGLVILFGGSNHQGVMNDLWSWDGRAWKKLAEGGPEPRVMGYIAYDQKRDRIVLFGGRRGVPDNADLGDTWEWDGATWKKI
jgi:hypothetical protein